ncbi:hypothetical protein HAX54_050804, partial [Datura stramonium]|nr:hypothetical protein [Datura stramonium]
MASRANKDKEVATSNKRFKRLRKGVVPSSSVPCSPTTRRFGAKPVEEHGHKLFNAKKKSNMPRRIGLMKVVWHLSSPPFVIPFVSWGL